jgi:anti-sigma factor RsiW
MKIEEAKKLVDLFVDDELPMELASEFKQAMFEDAELREEVAELRNTKSTLLLGFEGFQMTDDEHNRIRCRILMELGISETPHHANIRQMQLPIGR